MFSQSRVKISASLTDVGNLAVGAFDLVNCSLSVVGFVLSLTLVSKCRNTIHLTLKMTSAQVFETSVNNNFFWLHALETEGQ